ncbi:MAG: phosphate ABC transporter permease PstA [Elusimicrobiota bacterium]|nr:phosphate ABC transporter permease PstA [Elusimicrobiota bacterium]
MVQKLVFSVFFLVTLFVIISILTIFFIIFKEGVKAISWEFLTTAPTRMGRGGIFPAIIGTLYLTLGTIIFAVPLGVLSGIFLTEYAKENLLTRLVRLSIINLAGIPSIIYGLFGFALFVIFLGFRASLLSGCLTLSIMTLPIIITATKEALLTVPQAYREISLSLGATKWQTIRCCVLPYALPGILTGIILSIGRAAGETAPILFTAAAFYLPHLPKSIFDQVMALPYHLYVVSTQIPNVDRSISYGICLVLILLVLVIDSVAIYFRYKLRQAKKW